MTGMNYGTRIKYNVSYDLNILKIRDSLLPQIPQKKNKPTTTKIIGFCKILF